MSKNLFGRNGIIIVMLLCTLVTMLGGCCCCCPEKTANCEVEQNFVDSARPEWSYDQPYYYRPAGMQTKVETAEQQIPEVYTQISLLEIPRPAVGDDTKAPRMAIWMSKDYCVNWERIGYFGLQQKFYPFDVQEDGTYSIRFIGPGMVPTKSQPAEPHIIYHVDTQCPEIVLQLDPHQEYLYAGQKLKVSWEASDPYLAENPVTVEVSFGRVLEIPVWETLAENCSCRGSLEFEVPDEALDKMMVIRVTAWDKADNLGRAYTCPIMICYRPIGLEDFEEPVVESTETVEGEEVITDVPDEYPSLED